MQQYGVAAIDIERARRFDISEVTERSQVLSRVIGQEAFGLFLTCSRVETLAEETGPSYAGVRIDQCGSHATRVE